MKRAKYLVFQLFFVLSIYVGHGQILEPAHWECSVDVGEGLAIGDVVSLIFKVDLDKGWYIYSPDQDPDLGPVPTSARFEESGSFKVIGKSAPIGVKEKYDDVWKGTVRIIDGSGGGFYQRIKVLKADFTMRGTIIYTACSEETGQCIFPEEDFEIHIKTQGKR